VVVVGSTSGAGKSTVTAGLCRSYARRGVSVAPFKAQNMSNHAAVTADGGEVGRAQAVQAAAAGVDVERRMNPILLKPSAGNRSHVVVMGDEVGTTDAVAYGPTAEQLKATVLSALNSLRGDHQVVIAEGAGGAAEINLLERDLVNLPLAAAAGLPALLVVDIERGGAFAAAHGSVDLLPPQLRSTVRGIVFNSFRGDPSLLDSGIAQLEERTGVPFLGVLPHLGDAPVLGAEDSLDFGRHARSAPRSAEPIRVAVIHLPHLANPSDIDPLLHEPDVEVRWVVHPSELAAADLVIVPGSRSTVADLTWMRRIGFDSALAASSASILGICAGLQILGDTIDDRIESDAGTVPALGLLPVHTTFAEPKIVRRSSGVDPSGLPVHGYQIRFGRPHTTGAPWLTVDGAAEGAVSSDGRIVGTSLHGILDDDEFRSGWLQRVGDHHGRTFRPSEIGFTARYEDQHDRLADWVEAALGIETIDELVGQATTPEASPGW
jgi:adenosylcobyric acid synthase